jgi:hypothetical protein
MAADPREYDAQDAAEAFDEDNLDDDDTGPDAHEFKTFEELPDMFDDTQRLGDGSADARAYDDGEFSDGLVDDEDIEGDPIAARSQVSVDDLEDDQGDLDEVELEFTPDVEARKGAQGSAAHFESRAELSNEDLQELGYRDGADEESSNV